MTLSTSTVTLAPGSSRTYTLAPGEAVTVATEPNCYVTVTETPDVITTADQGGQTNVRTSILQYKGEWTYGPYALGGTVVVAVSLSKSTSSVSATLGSAAGALVASGSVLEVDAESIGSRTVTGTTNLTSVATVTVPGGTMTANGKLVISLLFSMTNNANGKAIRVVFGSMTIGPSTNTSSATLKSEIEIWNRGATNSQVAFGSTGTSFGGIGAAVTTGTVDTTADQTIDVQVQLTNSADTITLEAFSVVYHRLP